MHDLNSFPYSYDIPILLEYEKGIRNFQTFLLNFFEIPYDFEEPIGTFRIYYTWTVMFHGGFLVMASS
jgi:hypothetical protein